MHAPFYKDDSKKYSCNWFAWANTFIGKLLWKTYNEKPLLLI